MGLRVLIVDDSALMRKYLTQILSVVRGIELHTARDGADALARIEELDPDVVTLDINMPVMDGLTCLSHIMADSPRPVVMVSSLTQSGALATFEALELGAVDFVAKPGGTISLDIKRAADEIVAKVRSAAKCQRLTKIHREPLRRTPRLPSVPRSASAKAGMVLIGVSTGGPRALEEILPLLPADFPWPVLVAQHMPGSFTGPFATRLNRQCALDVREVDGAVRLVPGQVLIARGEMDVILATRQGFLNAVAVPLDPDHAWHPSVDRMVHSALEHRPAPELIGVELTGMGNDGAAAMAELHRQGGRTIAESEETAVVFGMPRELIALGGATRVLPSHGVARQLCAWADAGIPAADTRTRGGARA